MDIYTTSFTYPRASPTSLPPSALDFPSPYGLNSFANDSQAANAFAVDADAVQKVVLSASATHGCLASFTKAAHGRGWNFHLSGSYQQVMAARGMILRECPTQHRASIKLTRSEILDLPSTNPVVKPEVRARLDDIAAQTNVRIAVVNSPQSVSLAPPDGVAVDGSWIGLETERVCELAISGNSVDCVDVARVRLLVMLDELNGLHSEMCEIDHKLHAIIAGRRRCTIQSIQEETGTNIYFPSPLQGLVGPEVGQVQQPIGTPRQNNANNIGNNVIWITGEFFGVQRARDMLVKLSAQKSKQLLPRDAAILPRKLDWMLTDRMDDLKTIMNDNATFINFPAIGSSTSLITVYGDNKVNIQRTIRSIMQLACQFYVTSLWLLPVQFNVLLPPSTLNPAQMTNVLKQISDMSGAEVVFKSMCFEMHGLEHEVRAAISMLLELDAIKAFQHEIRFQIELANEHREFISGKKNGKINKIMQTSNVKIKFETFNDHNFLIDIASNDAGALQGLSLLQEELPAEVSFHVPEAYHKRIIGVGGKSIQRIMKKWGVYVKFSNADEFAALGGYLDNEDNVVARTPAKNAMNLENLKAAVTELVNPKERDYMTEKIAIPRRYHRTLLGEKSIFIHDIESKTNCKFRFPDKETASDVISIFGPESQVHIAATMLLGHVPFEAELSLPPSADIGRVCSSPEFLAFTERIKRDFQVSIVPNIKSKANNSPSVSPGECSIKFICQRSNSDFLATAREHLEQFFVSQNVPFYPTFRTHRRADSFAESLPHFDSKLLSAAHSNKSASFSLPSRRLTSNIPAATPPEASVDRRLRMASSSPDVKALFDSHSRGHVHSHSAQQPPTFLYNIEQEDNTETDSVYDSPSADYWTPLPIIGAQQPLVRTHQSEESLKRGSDSLLQEKIKDKLNKPRSMQNRAQSLDLTYSLARITEAGTVMPESPTTSIPDEDTSRPTSATVPSFPSVYGPPGSGNAGLQHTPLRANSLQPARAARILDEESVDEVARVISNLGL
ncbi:cytoplasmic protein [Fomitiporia mediterranea MF3/22]|uniref:cytoplasmic protein n=1 Tax=Fomitiporia mediterranea (strain MF3/22) TaxID=694068 RepID=UPI0004407484|nr:cytoplasmic protein [Fomitiporia mediterranea MF3/22]EJD04379.1 cytoplasmic protein [Fomitiporia mediterranea MF3/22]